MSKRDFQHFMYAYINNYYSTYADHLEAIGDDFFMMEDGTFAQWITQHGAIYSYEKANAPLSRIHLRSGCSETLPAYAVALQELLYEEFDEADEEGHAFARTRNVDLTQKKVSEVCHVARSSISNWENGITVPRKYAWWALAIGLLDLNYQDIVPYMNMIGCTVDMTCKDDIILYYAMCREKTTMEIYCMLKQYGCSQTMEYFAPAGKAERQLD